jgi:hypothetical protein
MAWSAAALRAMRVQWWLSDGRQGILAGRIANEVALMVDEQTLDEKYDTPFEIKKLDMQRKVRVKTGEEAIEDWWK